MPVLLDEKIVMNAPGEARVLSPRDASILSLIARLSPNRARQSDTFERLKGTLDTDFSREIAALLVGAIDPERASKEAVAGAKAMQEWVDTKIKRLGRFPTSRFARIGLPARLFRRRAR